MNLPPYTSPPQTLTADQAMDLANQLQSRGQLQEAEYLLQKILQQQPDHPYALHLSGVIAFQTGKLSTAAGLIHKAITLKDDIALFHANMCEIARQLKQFEISIVHGERAIELDPSMAMAHSNLGIIWFDRKEYDKAEACQLRALAIVPDLSASLNNLGSIWRERGNNKKALDYYRKAASANPLYLEALNNLGALLLEEDCISEAVEVLGHALKLNASHPELLCNIGGLHLALEEYDQALEHYCRALSMRPVYFEAQMGMTRTLQALDNLHEAKQAALRAVQFDNENHKAHALLASILAELSRPAEAEAEYEKALQLKPESNEALLGLGHLCAEIGQLERAKRLFLRALDTKPDNTAAHIHLVQNERVSPDNSSFAALLAEEAQLPGYSENHRIALHFSLGKCYDDIKDYDKAFPHFLAGCQLKRAKFDYNADSAAQHFDELKKIFNKDFIDSLRGDGESSSAPIFVLGMPRSGTTLTEQIIASHPEVFGGGELPDLLRIAHRKTRPATRSFPENLRHLDTQTLRSWGAEYVNAIRQRAPDARHITDKMPTNFFAVPLIHLMLPNAKIIHVNRNPVDTCLSCFTRLFYRKQEHTYDLSELGRYYADYARMMDRWREVLPKGAFLDIQYEDIVADQGKEIRRLLAFCNLEWNDACLDFHKTERQVRTSSVAQVRQPIYGSSVDRWRNYEKFLGPLLEQLRHLVPEY